jgi:hypothetical protein
MTTMMAALVKANVTQHIVDYKKYVEREYLGTADKAQAEKLVFENKQFAAAFASKK